MNFSRRKVMALIGASPLAAKAAASKLAAEGQAANMTGVMGNAFSGGAPGQAFTNGPSYMTKSMVAASQFVKTFGLPAGIEAQMRESAKYVGCLDPDIASKRSWSLNVKIQAQRERNFQRSVERIHRSSAYRIALDGVESVLPGGWPFG